MKLGIYALFGFILSSFANCPLQLRKQLRRKKKRDSSFESEILFFDMLEVFSLSATYEQFLKFKKI